MRCSLSASGLCVFRELCPVSFLVVGECLSVVVVMGKWSDDSAC